MRPRDPWHAGSRRRPRPRRIPEEDSIPAEEGLEATSLLLERCRAGDTAARDRLFQRFLPLLRRWAHGRLPASARPLADTDDLVQVSLVRALNHV
ncbi:MAG: hypothetical protein ABIP29_01995, partial [Candidatus Eisenbacteria bacterium]